MKGQASSTVAFRIYRTNRVLFYNSLNDAEAQCEAMGPETYTSCSRGQLKALATTTIDFNGYTSQPMTSMCNNGWVSEGFTTWYQVDSVEGGSCGEANSFNKIPGATGGAYHCCQAFPGVELSTPIYDTLKWAS